MVGGRDVSARVFGLLQHLVEQIVDSFDLGNVSGATRARYGRVSGPDKFPEADRYRLPKIHRWMPNSLVLLHRYGEEKIAVAQLFVGEARFLGPKQQSNARLGIRQSGTDVGSGVGETEQRMLKVAFAHGGRSENERAFCYRFSDRWGGYGRGEHLGGIDGRFSRFKWDWKVVDDSKIAEPEVVHGASDGPDVRGVAGPNEDDTDTITVDERRWSGETSHQVILAGCEMQKDRLGAGLSVYELQYL